MNSGVDTTTVTVIGAVYCTNGDASVNLYHNKHRRPRRREDNNIF